MVGDLGLTNRELTSRSIGSHEGFRFFLATGHMTFFHLPRLKRIFFGYANG
jgi:hypothetical protein